MTNIFFTADHHFHHANIIKYCNRPFSSVEEMNEVMIQRWNEIITPKDIVYHLGDFSLSDDDREVYHVISRLNGKIHIMEGNHDYWLEGKRFNPTIHKGSLNVIEPLYHLYVDHPELKKQKGHLPIVLCHYSLRTWNVAHYGAWHLFGHSHGQLPAQGKSFDVGVDTNNFYPYSLDEVSDKMKNLDMRFDLTKNEVWK